MLQQQLSHAPAGSCSATVTASGPGLAGSVTGETPASGRGESPATTGESIGTCVFIGLGTSAGGEAAASPAAAGLSAGAAPPPAFAAAPLPGSFIGESPTMGDGAPAFGDGAPAMGVDVPRVLVCATRWWCIYVLFARLPWGCCSLGVRG